MVDDDAVCYRHSDTRASVACQRCDRAICPQCMTTASVGFHCPQCVQRGGQRVITGRTLRPRSRMSRLVIALIVVNVIVFAAQDSVVDGLPVVLHGVLFGPAVEAGDWWRIVTSGFLHADTTHLGLNMISLFIFGNVIEPEIGQERTALVYIGGLLGGSAAVLTFNWEVGALGASGAVMGLAGGIAATTVARGLPLRSSGVVPLIVLNLVIPLFTNISFWGHFGGAAGGFVVAWLMLALPQSGQLSPRAAMGAGAAAVAALGVYAYYVGTYPLFF